MKLSVYKSSVITKLFSQFYKTNNTNNIMQLLSLQGVNYETNNGNLC